LRWIKQRAEFEAFLVSSVAVKDGVADEEARLARNNSKPFPAWNLRSAPGGADEAMKAWQFWSPDGVPRSTLL
jgi:hypothetical protein